MERTAILCYGFPKWPRELFESPTLCNAHRGWTIEAATRLFQLSLRLPLLDPFGDFQRTQEWGTRTTHLEVTSLKRQPLGKLVEALEHLGQQDTIFRAYQDPALLEPLEGDEEALRSERGRSSDKRFQDRGSLLRHWLQSHVADDVATDHSQEVAPLQELQRARESLLLEVPLNHAELLLNGLRLARRGDAEARQLIVAYLREWDPFDLEDSISQQIAGAIAEYRRQVPENPLSWAFYELRIDDSPEAFWREAMDLLWRLEPVEASRIEASLAARYPKRLLHDRAGRLRGLSQTEGVWCPGAARQVRVWGARDEDRT